MKKGIFEIIIGIVMMIITAGLWRVLDMLVAYLYDTTISERMNADVPINQMYEFLERTGNGLLFGALVVSAAIMCIGFEHVMRFSENKNKEKIK